MLDLSRRVYEIIGFVSKFLRYSVVTVLRVLVSLLMQLLVAQQITVLLVTSCANAFQSIFLIPERRGVDSLVLRHKNIPNTIISTSRTVQTNLNLMQRPSELASEIDSAVFRPNLQEQARYVRWSPSAEQNSTTASWLALQTAVTTWTKGERTLCLHSQIHLGSKSYYESYMTDPIFDSTPTLYELLVDQELLQYETPDLARLQQPVQASTTDQSLALQYGLECQANIIDYARRNWYHADWTRQEYATKVAKSFAPSSEAATALFVGPPLSTNKASRRRIFTNLFLPGNYFALFLRAVLWLAVPSPELSILLLDWSSTWQDGDNKSIKSQMISPIAQAVLQSIASGRWMTVRQLLFGQVLLAGHKAVGSSATDPQSACIGGRNDRALQVVDAAFETLGTHELFLLYGCNHCPDLHQKIQAKGFSCQGTEWRTVWSLSKDDSISKESLWKIPIVVGFICYLGIDGADWIGTIQEIVSAQDVASSGITALLYLARHVGLYLGMSKFLLDIDDLAASNAN